MAKLLETLGFKKKTHVGISLSTNNLIELVCIDNATKSVVRYSSGNVKYNNAIREIMDFDEFKEVVELLFEDAKLRPEECSVTINLPNVHFGVTSVESNYETPYLIENLQTEIDDLYIFKRNDPAISYSVLPASSSRNSQLIAFSAMQSKIIGRLIEVFDTLDADLERIDNSNVAFLKALQYCDRFTKYFEKEERTAVLLITPISCACFYMEGSNLYDYVEEPIAVKSLSTEEVYSTISKLAATSITKNNPQSLLIVSETDEVNAEFLSNNIDFNGEKDFFNKSVSDSDSFISVTGIDDHIDSSMVSYITLEAVGAAVSHFEENSLNINFLPVERIDPNIIEVGDYEINLYRFIVIAIVIAVLAALLLGFIVKFILNTQISGFQNSTQQAESDISVFKKRIDNDKNDSKKNVFPILKKVIENNNAVVNAYTQLSTDIPDDVYIKKFVSNPQGGIGILGEAKSSYLVETFVTKLRTKNPDLMVSRFAVNNPENLLPGQQTNGGLTFEIKTANIDVSLNEQENLLQQTVSTMRNDLSSQSSKTMGGSSLTPPPPVI